LLRVNNKKLSRNKKPKTRNSLLNLNKKIKKEKQEVILV
jgi:hypothetical protein